MYQYQLGNHTASGLRLARDHSSKAAHFLLFYTYLVVSSEVANIHYECWRPKGLIHEA